MKKLFAIVLAVAMIAAMAIAVSAEDITAKTGTFEAISVSTTYAARTDVHAYKVTLTYANLAFEYGAGSREWNAETMEWGADQGAAWGKSSGTITVTNQSSEDITATFAMTDTADDGVTMAMTGLDEQNKVVVGNALQGTAGTAQVTVSATGTPTKAGTLATITVSIA